MTTRFARLTTADGRELLVNLGRCLTLQETEHGTAIGLAGQPEPIVVREPVPEILRASEAEWLRRVELKAADAARAPARVAKAISGPGDLGY
jgi:hypothetical protein